MTKHEGFLINREGFGGLRISGNGADIVTETVIGHISTDRIVDREGWR